MKLNDFGSRADLRMYWMYLDWLDINPVSVFRVNNFRKYQIDLYRIKEIKVQERNFFSAFSWRPMNCVSLLNWKPLRFSFVKNILLPNWVKCSFGTLKYAKNFCRVSFGHSFIGELKPYLDASLYSASSELIIFCRCLVIIIIRNFKI